MIKIFKSKNMNAELVAHRDLKYFAFWYKKRRVLYINWLCGLQIGFFDNKKGEK